MSRIGAINELLDEWCASDNPLLAYTALLAASRNQGVDSECAVRAVLGAVERFADNALIVRGASALAMTLSADRVSDILAKLPQSPTATALRDEISWLCE
jgi:hypothetical protein